CQICKREKQTTFSLDIVDTDFGEPITETYHLCDAETIINKKFKITQEIKDTGIIEFNNGYPLSIFGVVKEGHEIDPYTGDIVGSFGLTFTSEQEEVIGKYSAGRYEGIPRLDIRGITNDFGSFHNGRGIPEISFEDVAGDRENLFIEIPRDDRRLKFRGDNPDASGRRGYPFETDSQNDITDQTIRINTTDLEVEDNVYVTLSLASERKIRENVRHLGKVGEANVFGIIGFSGEIGSEIDVFNYKIRKWKVPNEIPGEDATDSDYKLTLSEYQVDYNTEELEGWRLSEANTEEIEDYWAADYRGILRLTFNRTNVTWTAEEILHRSSIRDQDWFTNYLESLNFTIPTGPDGSYLPGDLEVKIEDKLNIDSVPGFLFDISEINNSLLFDNQKIPYYRPFALALANVSKYDSSDLDTGVGISHLDLFYQQGLSLVHGYDLSGAEFITTESRPRFIDSCDEEYKNKIKNSCHIYDPAQDGRLFLSKDFIENEVLEWRPSGWTIESYWLLQTGYFCGNFTSNSRIYVEEVGGNSINNFSMIYADTVAAISSTISADRNSLTNASYVAFKEEEAHASMACHFFSDGELDIALDKVEIDTNKSHQGEEIKTDDTSLINSHDKYRVIGYNNMLGDIPSYNVGSPIENALFMVCNQEIIDFFETVDLLDPIYGLDFTDIVPKASLEKDTFLYRMAIKYKDNSDITAEERYATLYFDDKGLAINNILMPSSIDYNKSITTSINTKYYYGGPISFLGEFWKKADIEEITAVLVDDRFKNYKIDADQMSVIDDEKGRVYVFYADIISGNLSVVVSEDGGRTWTNFKDLLRLLDGEIVSLPLVLKSYSKEPFELFYVLNDKFLMYRKFDTNLLDCEDANIEYNRLEEYELDTPDDDLEPYTAFGKELRKETSYFIVGDASDEFLINQVALAEEINSSDNDQSVRFDFLGDIAEMIMPFSGKAYFIHTDEKGINRLFFTLDGRLYIKSSGDFYRWKYDVKDIISHRNFTDAELNEGETNDIKNVQVVRDYQNPNRISFLYFHNGMLFCRRLRVDQLQLYYDSDGEKNNLEMKEHLEVSEKRADNPVFLIGNMPDK
ncbi:hypothetical protein LCGC14_1628800, partial [marine sediment metagenome]